MSEKYPKRKRPARGVKYVEGQPTVIYDTVCTRSKERWLANDEIHKAIVEVWSEEATAWLVGRYVIMPDHIHYFAWATDTNITYDNWVQFWKSRFSWKHGRAERRLQSDDWDTRMRSLESYEEKWGYVKRNPQRAGLVSDPDDWPYQGEVHYLEW